MRLTGRMDMGLPFLYVHGGLRRAARDRREAAGEGGELVDEALEERPHGVVRHVALRVDEIGLERNIGFAAHDMQPRAAAEHRAQMLLGDGRRYGAARGADNGGRLAGPGGLAPRPRTPVDGVLQHGGDRSAMLGGDEQQGV